MLARLLARYSALSCLLLCTFSLTQAATLRVGIAADMPPLAYTDQQLAGIEAANAQVIGKYLRYDIKYVEKPRRQLLNALNNGEVDIIMSGMTQSAGQLASQPVLDAPLQTVIRFDDAGLNAYKGILFRPGNKIGIIRDSAGAVFAADVLKQAALQTFETQAQALAALKSKRVDFVLLTRPEAQFLARDDNYSDLLALDHALSEDKIYWLVRPDNRALLQQINKALAEMQQTGTLRAIVNQWLPVSTSATN